MQDSQNFKSDIPDKILGEWKVSTQSELALHGDQSLALVKYINNSLLCLLSSEWLLLSGNSSREVPLQNSKIGSLKSSK